MLIWRIFLLFKTWLHSKKLTSYSVLCCLKRNSFKKVFFRVQSYKNTPPISLYFWSCGNSKYLDPFENNQNLWETKHLKSMDALWILNRSNYVKTDISRSKLSPELGFQLESIYNIGWTWTLNALIGYREQEKNPGVFHNGKSIWNWDPLKVFILNNTME